MAMDTSILLDRDSSGHLLLPSSIGQQVFMISSGLAGGLAGFVLASRLTTATHVRAAPLMLASLIASMATFGVVFMITEGQK